MSELLIARNPSPDSRLGFLIRLPLAGGTVFRTSDTWPRTKALFCYSVSADEWPEEPEIVERVALRSCIRRGAAIDLIADRGRESRSQIVYTKARGRDVVFWQAPRTRKQARPNVRVPTARASGLTDLQIVVDAHERYPYTFADRQATTVRRALPCGDYGLIEGGRLVASVERKSLPDLVSSLTNGKLRFALGELAALPRAAVVVEERYSAVFKLDVIRPAVVAEGLAELQVRYPNVPIVFCETRTLAAEWTYRFLGAARVWAETEAAISLRPDIAVRTFAGPDDGADDEAADAADAAPLAPEPETAEVRRWAREVGLEVPDRGRLKPSVWAAWHLAHRATDGAG
ncbi:ERCC4 domain-containing protein [Nakamurella lactea]|uniref:ERCC4 domain-containing protein n=1 Tax=Nakamurella lactea TaxID=459515 RepID=UPI000403AD61|nr:ERCC4 domain-containing protein [Nakamurella lactea]